MSLNRMAVRHQSRNPNQATTFHILAPLQQESDDYHQKVSRLLLQKANDDYLQRANDIKKNEVSDLSRLNKLHRIRNLK